MNKPNTKCRVCGKEYFCCADSRRIGGWKSMACSQECFKEYMRRIEESRTKKETTNKAILSSNKGETKNKTADTTIKQTFSKPHTKETDNSKD